MAELLEYLQQAVEDGASDLFLIAGGRVTCVPMLIARMPTQTERQAVVPMHALLCA